MPRSKRAKILSMPKQVSPSQREEEFYVDENGVECIATTWDDGKPIVLKIPQLPPESVIRTRPDRFSQTIPPPPRPLSLQKWLDEQLRGPLSPWVRRRIRDAILTGSCALLEVEFGRAGGTLSEKQKQELRDKCRDIAKTPVR